VNTKAKAQASAFLWSLVIAVAVTALVHAVAFNLPDWYSARASRTASSFEKVASRFSAIWMDNAFMWAGVVAAITFIIALPLLLWRASASARRLTAATPARNDAG
jgi:ABC-type spermidine/putrescine transport system permease subunit I